MRTGEYRIPVPEHANASDLLWDLLPSAALMLDKHTNADGKCACCGDRWPCDFACRAEFFLGGF